jgi:general secretion pathway protein E
MAIRRVGLEEGLRRHGVPELALELARSTATKAGTSLRETVLADPRINREALVKVQAEMSGLPVLSTFDFDQLDPSLVLHFPLTLARERRMLPLYIAEGQVVVGLADLHAMRSINDVRQLLGVPVRPVLMPVDLLDKATNEAYDRAAKSATDILGDVDQDGVKTDDDLSLEDAELLDDPNQAPIIRFVNALLSQAIKERASDIHIEPFEKDLAVRFRIDGVLHEKHSPPHKLRNPIVSRVKIMAGLNIAEKRLPQDGRIRRKMGGREVDMRVSTVPVRHGERVVMRILEKGQVFNLDGIGMAADMLAVFRKVIRLPHGILLVSGPTGSGKSTTLYSAVSEINEPDLNILTIEDPVEYELTGVGQVQVNHKIDLTFASALRAFLRQDPDVILVGEIRDRETAENAVQASLTGHMVFSTIHTNDAATAFVRLSDMGVEPFLVASSLAGVLAQRLVRRLCSECKAEHNPSDAELADVGIDRAQLLGHTIYKPVGCDVCQTVGYRGRLGIYEFLAASDEIKTLIIENADAGKVKKKAVELGMRTLREDGFLKVLSGHTSLDEVMRVTQVDSVEV